MRDACTANVEAPLMNIKGAARMKTGELAAKLIARSLGAPAFVDIFTDRLAQLG